MVTQQFGATAKAIRLNKHLTLTQVADDQLSIGTLSRFESGQADLTLSKFAHLLERLWTTPEEFVYRHLAAHPGFDLNGYQSMGNMLMRWFPQGINFVAPAAHDTVAATRARFDALAPALDAAVQASRDAVKQYVRPFWQLMREQSVDLAAGKFAVPHPEYTAGIAGYLRRLDDWGEFDLYLFTGFMTGFAPAEERALFQMALTRAKKFSHFRSVQEVMFQLIENQFNLGMGRMAYGVAKEALGLYAELLPASRNANQNLHYLFDTGWYHYRTGAQAEGIAACQQALTVTQFLGLTAVDADLRELFQFIQAHPASRDHERCAIVIA